jgi:hypothetical protein
MEGGSRVQPHQREEAPLPPDSQQPTVAKQATREECRSLDHFVDGPSNRVESEPAKLVMFADQEKSSPEAQYLVIPDDFDFDDSKAVIMLLENAKKNHLSSSRPRRRNGEDNQCMEQTQNCGESGDLPQDQKPLEISR